MTQPFDLKTYRGPAPLANLGVAPIPINPKFDAGAVLGAVLVAAAANSAQFTSFPASWAASNLADFAMTPATWGAALALGQAFTAAAAAWTAGGGTVVPTSSLAATVPIQAGFVYALGTYVIVGQTAYVCTSGGVVAGPVSSTPPAPFAVSLSSVQPPPGGSAQGMTVPSTSSNPVSFTAVGLLPFSEIWAAAQASADYDRGAASYPYAPA
jgi:hypothetical protein